LATRLVRAILGVSSVQGSPSLLYNQTPAIPVEVEILRLRVVE
jgi:hypothetical protein